MDVSKISTGLKAPWDVNVIIEIPQGGAPVKYEFDKESGALLVDRFIKSPMYYPTNYGFIPHTLADDGDPLDVLVVDIYPLLAGSVIRVRPIGVLHMEDEKGMDEKILAVPVEKLNSFYGHLECYTQLPDTICKQIEHFFTHYKDLEQGKWVKIIRWGDADEAADLITKTIQQNAA